MSVGPANMLIDTRVYVVKNIEIEQYKASALFH